MNNKCVNFSDRITTQRCQSDIFQTAVEYLTNFTPNMNINNVIITIWHCLSLDNSQMTLK